MVLGTSLVVQWLGLHAPNAGGPGSSPGQGTGSCTPKLKISHAATKTRRSQIINFFLSGLNTRGRKEIRGKGAISKSTVSLGRKDRQATNRFREQTFELG